MIQHQFRAGEANQATEVLCNSLEGPKMRVKLLLLVATLAAFFSGSSAVVEAQSIHGTVLDDSTSMPIVGAEVILHDSLGQTLWVEVTGRSGQFEMRPPPGSYSFEVLRMGYQPVYTELFEIAEEVGQIDLTITLPNAPVILDPAVIEAERQPFAPGPLEGFYARKRRGWGIQLDRQEIEAKAPVQFTDILRNLAGVRVLPAGGNKWVVYMVGAVPRLQPEGYETSGSMRGLYERYAEEDGVYAACPIHYFVDGIPYQPGGGGINEILVSDVEAVEVYRRASETPAEFLSSRSRCGVVVIWTKRGP